VRALLLRVPIDIILFGEATNSRLGIVRVDIFAGFTVFESGTKKEKGTKKEERKSRPNLFFLLRKRNKTAILVSIESL
jgi:hypothetical protein